MFTSRIMTGAYSEALDVLREQPGEGAIVYVDGKPVRRLPVKLRIHGSVQPLTGTELLIVPEGDRTTEQYSVYTADDLRLSDKIQRKGAVLEVQQVSDWGRFRVARAMRVDVGQPPKT